MGILDRFADILKANINDLLDKAEDPAKMIDQYMRDLTETLAEVKEETAAVMAEETRAKRMLDENAAEVEKYAGLARKALEAGNEGDARTFLAKKQQLEAAGASLAETYNVANENATKMRQMHDKLVSDIEALNSRREAVKAKVAVARAQEKVNEVASATDKAADAMNAFSRMEAKADSLLDKANAEATLNAEPSDPMADLEAKYASMGTDATIDAELEAMKKEMGL